MTVRKFSVAEAAFARSPGQDAEILVGNVIDQRHGGPVTVGFGRYAPRVVLEETIAVYDTMVVLKGSLTVESDHGVLVACGAMSWPWKTGDRVEIRSGASGAITAYVAYPHWQQPDA